MIGTSGPSISTRTLSIPEAREGGHQVLDRRHRPALAVADDGAEFGRGHREVAGVDQAVAAAGKPCSEESDAMIRFGGVQGDFDVVPGVDADPREGDGSAKRGLMALLHYSRPRPLSLERALEPAE
jgi:hypothetical protein